MSTTQTTTTAEKPTTDTIEAFKPQQSLEALEYHHPRPNAVTEDPYSWPFWTKIGITLNICANAFLNNVCAAGLVPTLSPVAAELGIPIAQASNLQAYNVLAQGLGNIIWVPTMLCFGKRWTILATSVLLLPCIAWSAVSTTYSSLLAARIVAGFASGASESFAPVIIGEILYERHLTTALGFFALCILAGVGLGQTCLGFVTENCGWRWAFWVTFIACAINFVTMILWLPETTYQRGLVVGDTAGDVERQKMTEENKAATTCPETNETFEGHARPFPYMRQNLWFIHHPHIQYRQNWFKCLLRPFQFFVSVPILWSSLTYAVAAGAFTAVGVCIPQLFAPPPYAFSPGAQGLFGLSSLLGTVLGGTVGSKLVDVFNAYMQKRRYQKDLDHKPEERLLMLVLPFCTCTTGLVIYGVTVQDHLIWVAPAAGYAIHSFGFATLASITYSYAVDSYIVRSGEVMVFNNTLRALISFGFADFVPNWMERVGPERAHSVLAAVVWGMLVLAIPVFFFGPKLRRMTNHLL